MRASGRTGSAAMIKAHPVQATAPWVLPSCRTHTLYLARHLDFAAIHDIHSIKRQIDAFRGGGPIGKLAGGVLGHNVKLGRGGIREIEFFAQTQQLIFGGRNPSLRLRGTCETLRALAASGHVAASAAEELIDAYRFASRRASFADGRRQADPHLAPGRRRPCRDRDLPRLWRCGCLRKRAAATAALRRGPLCAAVRGGAEPRRSGRQPGLHRYRRRSRHPGDPAHRWHQHRRCHRGRFDHRCRREPGPGRGYRAVPPGRDPEKRRRRVPGAAQPRPLPRATLPAAFSSSRCSRPTPHWSSWWRRSWAAHQAWPHLARRPVLLDLVSPVRLRTPPAPAR